MKIYTKAFFACLLLSLAPLLYAVVEGDDNNSSSEKVRILIQLEPTTKMVATLPSGAKASMDRPTQKIIQMLRADINEDSDFYFNDWHVEAKPLHYNKETKQYKTRLSFYKLFGENKNIEEKVGSVEVAGILNPQTQNLYNLVGTSASTFEDKAKTTQLKVIAGIDNHYNNMSPAIVKKQ